ncbi:Undecaprenyl phosphate-alpha-4-amino-4-deoxy-L-arabinose arabinosyl transferase [Hyphomicrobium sp. ghe19]|nr:Undecaprenyl phosphate-alpha-4-amino-4-deoxy-L-arabinose arabinosyl transferase [Hyphomicrobium sp. ghe19]
MTNEIVGFPLGENGRAAALQRAAQRVIQLWGAVAGRDFSLPLLIGVCLLVSVPPALFHGYHYVEGLTVTIAQSALDDGNWLTPHIYNARWIERPTLLSWLIAAISLPFGHVSPFIARLPIILSLLSGILLVWRALRPVASAEAAVFGAALFLASPIVMRYYVTSVADIPLAVVLFGAFLVWWRSYATGRISLSCWIGIGGLLAVAALMKGPQPVAYFMLGLLTFVAMTSTWWQIPGLILAGFLAAIPTGLWYAYVFVPGDQSEWLRYTRLASPGIAQPHPLANAADFFFESLPAALMAIALLLTGRSSVKKTVPQNFVLALSCYAFACTVVILFWPAEVNPRYVLPMVLPLCVLGGIAYDALSERRTVLVASGICITTVLLGYAAVHSVFDGLITPAYIHSKISGAQIVELVRNAPAPIYRTDPRAGLNEFSYVPSRVTTIRANTISTIAKPAWIVVPSTDAPAIIAQGKGRIMSRLALDHSILLRFE